MPGPVCRRAAPVAAALTLAILTILPARSASPVEPDTSQAAPAPLAAPTVPAVPAVPAEPTSPADLAPIARDPHWSALIHRARRRPDARARNALQRTGFLLSKDGRELSELEATLAAFTGPDPERAQAARCRFPARHHFLAEQSLVDPDRGPCTELDAWRAQIGDFDLTLIFPESFLGNPASMFGHTLLRFDPRVAGNADAESEGLLGWALDYTADSQGDAGALYLTRGLIGGYQGRFALGAYYEKTQVYSDWQDRDIWEYPLAMSAAERERLLLHVWELRDVALPYYFFTDNCSEKILELVETVWPGLGRGGGFPPMVAPVDTVRAIADVPDRPLGQPSLRESPATQLQLTMASLSRAEAALADALAEGRIAADDETFARRSDPSRARTLEAAYDLLRHRYLAGQIEDEPSRGRARALLIARSRVPIARSASEEDPATPTTSESVGTRELGSDKRPPDTGHGTARAELAGGIQDRDGFVELRVQPAYHEWLDAPSGFAEGGQIRALDTRLRIYPDRENVRLHELVVLDVATASPWRRPFRPLAWRFDLGLRTRMLSSNHANGLDPEDVFRFQGGIGAALAPMPRLLLYGFGELALEAGAELRGDASAGPLVRSGMTFTTPGDRASFQIEGIAGVLAGERTEPWLRAELSQRTSLTRSWSLVVTGRFEQAYDVGHFEGRVGATRYF